MIQCDTETAIEILKKQLYSTEKKAILITSKVGTGKVAQVNDFADKENLGFIYISLIHSLQPTIPSLHDCIEYSLEHPFRKHLKNHLFKEFEKGILYLSEMNIEAINKYKDIISLIKDRKIEDFKLPEGWSIVADTANIGDGKIEDLIKIFG